MITIVLDMINIIRIHVKYFLKANLYSSLTTTFARSQNEHETFVGAAAGWCGACCTWI